MNRSLKMNRCMKMNMIVYPIRQQMGVWDNSDQATTVTMTSVFKIFVITSAL